VLTDEGRTTMRKLIAVLSGALLLAVGAATVQLVGSSGEAGASSGSASTETVTT
jgi:hypothetical protein